jgi:hypothetical protein
MPLIRSQFSSWRRVIRHHDVHAEFLSRNARRACWRFFRQLLLLLNAEISSLRRHVLSVADRGRRYVILQVLGGGGAPTNRPKTNSGPNRNRLSITGFEALEWLLNRVVARMRK